MMERRDVRGRRTCSGCLSSWCSTFRILMGKIPHQMLRIIIVLTPQESTLVNFRGIDQIKVF